MLRRQLEAAMAEVAIEKRFEFEVRDLEYRRTDGTSLLARLYRPLGSGPFPSLIDVHGGVLGFRRSAQQRAARRGAREERHCRVGDRFSHAAAASVSRLDR